MTACISCPRRPAGATLSNMTTTVIAVIAAMTFSASRAAVHAALPAKPGEPRPDAVHADGHLRRLRSTLPEK
jgi:hypothetical protein